MCSGIVVATYMYVHVAVAWQRFMSVAITAIRMMMVEGIYVMPIVVNHPAVVGIPVGRVVTPVIGRVPNSPTRSPEPVVDYRTGDIYRFNNIISAINILISNHLNGNLLCCRVALNKNGCHILVYVFCQYSLQNNQMPVLLIAFNNTQVVNSAITVEVEVRDTLLRIVQSLLKFFQVFCLAEDGSNGFQVEVGRDICICRCYCDCLVGINSDA